MKLNLLELFKNLLKILLFKIQNKIYVFKFVFLFQQNFMFTHLPMIVFRSKHNILEMEDNVSGIRKIKYMEEGKFSD